MNSVLSNIIHLTPPKVNTVLCHPVLKIYRIQIDMAFDRAYLYLTAADNNGNVGGKYKRLSFSYSEVPGGSDETGRSIGPVRTVAITARGYWGDFPSKLDIEGILSTFGFDVTEIDVFKPAKTMHKESTTQFGHRSMDTYIQAKFPAPASDPASSKAPSSAAS